MCTRSNTLDRYMDTDTDTYRDTHTDTHTHTLYIYSAHQKYVDKYKFINIDFVIRHLFWQLYVFEDNYLFESKGLNESASLRSLKLKVKKVPILGIKPCIWQIFNNSFITNWKLYYLEINWVILSLIWHTKIYNCMFKQFHGVSSCPPFILYK
jgi:hypothetical protein